MSPTATYTRLYTDASYSLRLRGTPLAQHQQSAMLSPIYSPQLVGLGSPYPPPLPPVDYDYDRSQAPPPAPRMGCIDLPETGGGPINPLLERAPLPMIVYNIAQDPSRATLERRRSAYGRSFDEAATFSGSTSVTIRVPFTDKPIVVHRLGAVVTVGDVLVSIHAALMQAAAEQGRGIPRSLLLSNDRSARPSATIHEQVLASLLANRSQWAGLSPSTTEPDVWILHIR